MAQVTIALVLGTAREGNESVYAMDMAGTLLLEYADVLVHRIHVKDHVSVARTVPPWGPGGTDETPTPWQDIASSSDGFLFVIPEYNRGYPGEWKLLVDSLYSEYAGKVAGLVGVSDGAFGGARVVEHARSVLVELGLIPLKGALHVPLVKDTLSPDGTYTDPDQHERARKYIRRFVVETMRQRAARDVVIEIP